MRFAFILAERACWPVVVMCAVLKVSASGFYAWLRSSPSARDKKDERLKVLIGESFAKSRKTYGSPRVHADLVGERVGRAEEPGRAVPARAADDRRVGRLQRERPAESRGLPGAQRQQGERDARDAQGERIDGRAVGRCDDVAGESAGAPLPRRRHRGAQA